MQLPPAMEAATRPQQAVDFEYERKVMQEEASSSVASFLNKPEVSAMDRAACAWRSNSMAALLPCASITASQLTYALPLRMHLLP